MLKTFWAKTPGDGVLLSNFGDLLTPVILSHYGIDFCYADAQEADVFCVGSIAKNARSGTIVLGSGAMRVDEKLCADAKWIWVRGPRTRSIVIRDGGICPEIYGDPALLLPEIFSEDIETKHKIGLVPHIRHYREAKKSIPIII